MLCKEFERVTGKSLEIKDNSYYRNLLETDPIEEIQAVQEKLPDFNLIREQVQSTIGALCKVEAPNDWGFLALEKTFAIRKKVDADYMEVIFNCLKEKITNHIFDAGISANEVLDLDGRIANTFFDIPISAIESANQLHENIKTKYSDFLPQFYATSAKIINMNYLSELDYIEIDDENGELPF